MPTSRREWLAVVLAAWPTALVRGARAAATKADRAAEIEWHIAFLTNQQRTWRRIPLLEASDALSGIARRHSGDMLARGFFDHRNPEGIGPADRIARQGLRYTHTSENIYRIKDGTTDPSEMASIMVTGWMDTKGHRRNILDPAFRVAGVGVAATDRVVLATQLFGA